MTSSPSAEPGTARQQADEGAEAIASERLPLANDEEGVQRSPRDHNKSHKQLKSHKHSKKHKKHKHKHRERDAGNAEDGNVHSVPLAPAGGAAGASPGLAANGGTKPADGAIARTLVARSRSRSPQLQQQRVEGAVSDREEGEIEPSPERTSRDVAGGAPAQSAPPLAQPDGSPDTGTKTHVDNLENSSRSHKALPKRRDREDTTADAVAAAAQKEHGDAQEQQEQEAVLLARDVIEGQPGKRHRREESSHKHKKEKKEKKEDRHRRDKDRSKDRDKPRSQGEAAPVPAEHGAAEEPQYDPLLHGEQVPDGADAPVAETGKDADKVGGERETALTASKEQDKAGNRDKDTGKVGDREETKDKASDRLGGEQQKDEAAGRERGRDSRRDEQRHSSKPCSRERGSGRDRDPGPSRERGRGASRDPNRELGRDNRAATDRDRSQVRSPKKDGSRRRERSRSRSRGHAGSDRRPSVRPSSRDRYRERRHDSRRGRRSRSRSRERRKRSRSPEVDVEALAAKMEAALEGGDAAQVDEDKLIEERRRRRAEILAKHRQQQEGQQSQQAAEQQPPPPQQQEVVPQSSPAPLRSPAPQHDAAGGDSSPSVSEGAEDDTFGEEQLWQSRPLNRGPGSTAALHEAGTTTAGRAADGGAASGGVAGMGAGTAGAGQRTIGYYAEVAASEKREREAALQAVTGHREGAAVGAAGGGGTGLAPAADEAMPPAAAAAPGGVVPEPAAKDEDGGGGDVDMFDSDAEADIFAATPAGGVANAGRAPPKGRALVDAYDDAEGYYNFQVGEVMTSRYEVLANVGKGVFSTVLKAKDLSAPLEPLAGPREVAIKVIRANDTMYKAGQLERTILLKLSGSDPEGKRHCVRLERTFDYRGHLCLVFEPMDMNLRELTKKYGRGVGLNVNAVRLYAAQLLQALYHMRNCGVVHADLKPDNILVNDRRNVVKVCDFGSAMFAGEDNEVTPYLVSRFYRPPEVILGMKYDHALDMWSMGCVLFELFTGRILFPGRTNNEMLKLVMEAKGPMPKRMLRKGVFVGKHFEGAEPNSVFCLLEEDRITGRPVRRLIPNPTVKKDFSAMLAGADGDRAKVVQLADLLDRMMALDPEKRITAKDALRHPFIKDHPRPQGGRPGGRPPPGR